MVPLFWGMSLRSFNRYAVTQGRPRGLPTARDDRAAAYLRSALANVGQGPSALAGPCHCRLAVKTLVFSPEVVALSRLQGIELC